MDGFQLDRGTADALGVMSAIAVFGFTFIELLALHFGRRGLDLRVTRMVFLGYGSSALVGFVSMALFGVFTVGVAAVLGASLAPYSLGTSWYGLLLGFFVYEFFYWVQHWAAHKVRLLWCLHAPHHSPRGINMAIGTNHHFLESLFYFPIWLGFLPALAGVDPVACVAINVLDSFWGSFLHLSEAAVPEGRYGILGRFLQTPAYHRVHHAKNPRYMDRNYNSITLFWDWALGTLEPLDDAEPVRFGITRDVDDGSFWDVHFGEFRALGRDVIAARSPLDALGYVFRAPGWKPGDHSHTASAIREQWRVGRAERGAATPAGTIDR